MGPPCIVKRAPQPLSAGTRALQGEMYLCIQGHLNDVLNRSHINPVLVVFELIEWASYRLTRRAEAGLLAGFNAPKS